MIQWLRRGHPNIVQFLATFAGVAVAFGLGLGTQWQETQSGTSNIVRAAYIDCQNVWNRTIQVKDDIRAHLGMPIKDVDTSTITDLLEYLGLQNIDEAPLALLSQASAKIDNLGVHDRQVYNSVQLPGLGINALMNNPDLFARLHPDLAESLLLELPSVHSANQTYEFFRQKAEVLDEDYRREIAMLMSFQGQPGAPVQNVAGVISASKNRHRNVNIENHLQAISALDNYGASLFNMCYYLQLEWKLRNCSPKPNIEAVLDTEDYRRLDLECPTAARVDKN